MRTVEEIKNSGYYKWLNNPGYTNLLRFCQNLEDNHYIVQEVFRTGKVRVKLPEWYLLNRNENNNFNLLSDLSIQFDKLDFIHIGKYSMYLRQGYFK